MAPEDRVCVDLLLSRHRIHPRARATIGLTARQTMRLVSIVADSGFFPPTSPATFSGRKPKKPPPVTKVWPVGSDDMLARHDEAEAAYGALDESERDELVALW